jgi:hypothetical protein
MTDRLQGKIAIITGAARSKEKAAYYGHQSECT